MGSSQVSLTEAAEKSLMAAMVDNKAFIAALAEAVKANTQVAMLEELRNYARAEGDLARARADIVAKDAEIAGLNARLQQLSGLLSYTPAAPAIAVTAPVPTWDQRYAAQVPVPAQAPWSGNGFPIPTQPADAPVPPASS